MEPSKPESAARPGFGTAHLMGRIGLRQSTELVHAALDCGIVHFDTARLYGLGDSEMMLGRALRNRPDVTVYTKVGLGSPSHSSWRSRLYASVRPLARARARLGAVSPRFSGPAITYERQTDFSPGSVRKSVETSLRMLRRETLDGLLLHEITAKDATAALWDLMEDLKSEGKILRFGIASEPQALAGLEVSGFRGSIIQQAGGPFAEPITTADADHEIVLHSLFGPGRRYLHPFTAWLDENPADQRIMLELLAVECIASIPALLVSYTATRMPFTKIVFSSTSKHHISENATAVRHKLSGESTRLVTRVLAKYKKERLC